MPDDRSRPLDLPHFALAPATKHDPEQLLKPGDKVGAFLLALAVIFNDLKGLVWFHHVLTDQRPNESTILEHRGQWYGMGQQITKYAVAVVHELFELIRKRRALLYEDEIQSLTDSMPPQLGKMWATLVSVAMSDDDSVDGEFARTLRDIRNNLSHHYYDPRRLVAGYHEHFGAESEDPTQNFAYVSFGKNMAETRFYYGDAAVMAGLERLKRKADFDERMRDTLDQVSLTLSDLVYRFVQSRSKRDSR